MNKEKHPFVFNYGTSTNTPEYLGTDGLPIEETYNLYIRKCEEFKAKARKYAKDNLCTKNSTLQQSKCGYISTKELEEEVLLQRMEFMDNYTKDFDVAFFNDDPSSKYESFTATSKRIRIVRDLHQSRNEELSHDFDKKKCSWFTRYCILSRFIEAARKIILLNRLHAVLAILKTVTPQMIRQMDTEEGESEEEEEEKTDNINEEQNSKIKMLPCTCR